MIEKTIVGIDPSFTRTGISVVTLDKKIFFKTLSHPIGKKDFPNTYSAAYALANQLKDYLEQFKPYDVVMEYAPPISSMSPALYSLDSLYHYVLHDNIRELYNPIVLTKIIGHKGRTKAESVVLALSIVEELKQNGWEVQQKRKPCHDCCEALIYINYYLKNLGVTYG